LNQLKNPPHFVTPADYVQKSLGFAAVFGGAAPTRLGLVFHGKGIISSYIQQITLLHVSVCREVEPVQPSGQSKEHATTESVNALTIRLFLRPTGPVEKKDKMCSREEIPYTTFWY
jgi:hypothetical protein